MRGYRNGQLIPISVATLITASQAYTRLLFPTHPAHTYLPNTSQTPPALPVLPLFLPPTPGCSPSRRVSKSYTLLPLSQCSSFCLSNSSDIFSHSSTFSHFLNSMSSCSLCMGVILLNSSIPLKIIEELTLAIKGNLENIPVFHDEHLKTSQISYWSQ